ncbi:MAG: hypothetical protein FJ335_10240 [Sphingomonadales bacterium]|nr:hypothetical protein [Sphingomonadales bacterium]
MNAPMSTRRRVAQALAAGMAAAVPGARIRGFDGDAERPERVSTGGEIIGFDGSPGTPQIDLSPPAYNYDHVFSVELAAGPGDAQAAALDAMLLAIGVWIDANRTLGGLCSYLDVRAAETDETVIPGASPQQWATVDIIASYTTSNPLG